MATRRNEYLVLQVSPLRLDEPFAAPTRSHPSDAGLDLMASRYISVFPDQNASIPTNMAMKTPYGTFGLILPRSSTLQSRGLYVSPGVIDAGYRGEVMISVRNLTTSAVSISIGERIAQLLILPCWDGTVDIVKILDPGDRGDKGFGSTGA